MLYSVWNTGTKRYDYYQSPQAPASTHVGAPPPAFFPNALGATVEQAAWALPVGCTKIGAGELARGRVCKPTGGGLLGLGDLDGLTSSPIALGALALGAYLWWRKS